jgi:hypothetical protein
MADQGGHGAFETHMIVDAPARKWADLLRRHSRGKHLNKERSPLREHEIRDVEAPTYRKANTKCYANIASVVIEHERRYDAL